MSNQFDPEDTSQDDPKQLLSESKGKERNIRKRKIGNVLENEKREPLKDSFDVEERPNKCNLCEKRFISVSALNQHISTHLKPFNCDTCEKSFSRKDRLENHKKIHSDVEFKCTICDIKFGVAKYLERHMKSHEVKQIKCGLCSEVVMSGVNLKHHAINKHGYTSGKYITMNYVLHL